ncbi:MAG: SAV_6107 family HEPN domain-containing protein [Sporichthyaceae bacterium]
MNAPDRRRAGELAAAARRDLALAELAELPASRYAAAHLAALRAAAAVLAARPPAVEVSVSSRGRSTVRRRRPTSAWDQLPVVAPELGAWAARFAAGAAKRAAAEAGFRGAVDRAEADELLAAARTFLALVEAAIAVEPAILAG